MNPQRPTLSYATPRPAVRGINRAAWIIACAGGIAGGLTIGAFERPWRIEWAVASTAATIGAIVAGAATLSARRCRVRFGFLAILCFVLTATALILLRLRWAMVSVGWVDALELAILLGAIAGLPGLCVSMAIGIARVDPSEFESGSGQR